MRTFSSPSMSGTNSTTPIPRATYHIQTPPEPPTTSAIDSYRRVRLTALRMNPEAFTSTYEREVAFPEEIWRDRLVGEGKVTLFAEVLDRGSSRDEQEGGGDYAGMIGVVGAKHIPDTVHPHGMDATRTYFMFGMWVHPEHRQKGVGRKLMEAGLAWARRDAREGPASKAYSGEGSLGAFEVWLSVKQLNHAAKTLYEGLGFKEVESLGQKREVWMRRKLDESNT